VQGRIDAADGQLKKLRMQLEAAQYGKKGDGELPPPGTFTSDNPAGVRFPTATPQRLLLLLCARYAVAALFLLCFLSTQVVHSAPSCLILCARLSVASLCAAASSRRRLCACRRKTLLLKERSDLI
jgi:hypothetical protein